MRLERLLPYHSISDFFETAFPDFILAFAFFASLFYVVLAKRFEKQRAAIAISVVSNLALSIGFIW